MKIVFAVIPVLLLLCKCGGGAAAGNFQAFPFDQREQLISYHTEGQGEDKVACVLHHGKCQALEWGSCVIALGVKLLLGNKFKMNSLV